MIYIYHQPNIGDHIIMNGLIRHHAEKSDVTVFCLDTVESHIKYMYRDNSSIKILSFKSHLDIEKYIIEKKINIHRYGWQSLFKLINNHNLSLSFDECLYKLANINFNIRFNKFYVQRDHNIENEVYYKHNSSNNKYIYVHDDKDKNFIIDKNKYRNDYKIINNDMNYNIFQMRKILENATEIHTMQTGMFDFCNSIQLDCPIYVHLYVRKYPNLKFLSKSPHTLNLVY